MRAILCSPEHIGQVVAWGRVYGPGVVADGAEALARANIVGLVKRYHLDLASDWESRLARKFGGYEDLEQYIKTMCQVSEAIDAVCAVLSCISVERLGSDIAWKMTPVTRGGVDVLFVLRDGLQMEEERQERIELGKWDPERDDPGPL